MKRFSGLILLSLVLFYLGCARATNESSSNSTTVGNAKIVLASESFSTELSKEVKVVAVIKNVGSETAYNVNCNVSAFKGTAVVQQSVTADISAGLTTNLKPDDFTVFHIILNSLTSHDEYDKLQYVFTWREDYTDEIISLRVIH